MSISAEQIKEGETGYEIFKVATGEAYAAYLTPVVEDQDLRVACDWGTANLPGGFAAFKEIGAFEISFRECARNGTLQRDPAWLSRAERKGLFKQLNDTLPAAISKAIYLGDAYSLSDEQLSQLTKIGGQAAFKMFIEEA